MIKTVLTPSTLENMDMAVYEFLNNMNVGCMTQNGWKKVPIVWAASERAFSVKKDQDRRDNKSTLQYPLISVEALGIAKPTAKQFASTRGNQFGTSETSGSIVFFTEINQEKTADRANGESLHDFGVINFPRKKAKRPVFNIFMVPQPVYTEKNFKVTIRTNFIQQMNQILVPFINAAKNTNWTKVIRNGHGYEIQFLGDFNPNSNLNNMSEEERKIEFSFDIKLIGYLMGDEMNSKGLFAIKHQSFAEIKFRSETIMTGNIPK